MNPISLLLIFSGVILILFGLGTSGLLGPFGRLPGDISIQRPGFSLYIPLTTSILLSLVLTGIMYLVQRWWH